VHARAYGLDAIDVVNIHYKQPEILEAEAREGAALGFTGKQIIHPGQVDIVQRMFSPSESQLKEAMAILSAFYDHEAKVCSSAVSRSLACSRRRVMTGASFLIFRFL
jgi:citrate lyase subunit beta-like protein